MESVDISEAPVAGVYEPGSEYSGESLRIRDGNWFVALGQGAREVIDLSAHLHGLSRTKAYCYGADEREQAVKDAADLAARRGRSKEVRRALQDFAGIAVTPEAILSIRHGMQPEADLP